jgi:hypothetical protein
MTKKLRQKGNFPIAKKSRHLRSRRKRKKGLRKGDNLDYGQASYGKN